jgi:hypothetical protein
MGLVQAFSESYELIRFRVLVELYSMIVNFTSFVSLGFNLGYPVVLKLQQDSLRLGVTALVFSLGLQRASEAGHEVF